VIAAGFTNCHQISIFLVDIWFWEAKVAGSVWKMLRPMPCDAG
jgi:hypothetical protein